MSSRDVSAFRLKPGILLSFVPVRSARLAHCAENLGARRVQVT